MLLIDHSHQTQVLFSLWNRFVVQLRTMNTQQLTLTTNTQGLMIEVDPLQSGLTSSRQLFF